MGSRSRSRSRSSSSGRLHLDRFGRVIPKSRRSRSHRSRSRSRERLRVIHYPRRRSRSRSRSRRSSRSSRRRSRSRDRPLPYRSRSHSRSNSPISGKTNLPDLKLMMSRVFIGNLPYDKITKEELEQMFAKYGKILGISIHERGFGFVQFEKEAEALEAVEQEGGSLLKGKNIDVKMALSGRRGGPPTKQSGPSVRPSPPPASSYDSDRYPAAGSRRPLPGAPAERERSPLRGDPYEDRYRDPYRDPVALPPRLAPPAAGVGGDSLPHRGGGRSEDIDRRDDPYRRPLPQDDPYYDRYRDDVYRHRRDPYPADPYRDPYYRDYPSYEPPPPARKPPPPSDVEIILMNSQLRNYGEFVERKLKGHNMVVLISVIPEDRTIQQVIEDSSKRGHLFAIVINSQNEAHQSLTVNILHGTPQEHRNMPVEDAMNLIPRSFDQYTQAAREKAAPAPERAPPPAAPSRGPPPFLPPGPDISYLLNLLADNRQVTLEEIDKVITYLRERKDKMYEVEGRRPPVESGVSYGAGGDVGKDDSASLQQQQQELQAKILSILNGPGETGGQHPKTGRPGMPMGNGAGQGSGQGVSSLINFDNPSVQKALDNLIQSGPNLLKNISSSPANPSPNPSLMSREGEPMRHEGRMSHGGFGGNSMAGSAPMQQSSRVGAGGGQGPMGGMQPSQRPMYGSVAGAPQQRLGGPMPQQGMRRQF